MPLNVGVRADRGWASGRRTSVTLASMHAREPIGGATRALAPLGPILTPHGRLLLARVDDAPALAPDLSRTLQQAFARGHGHGLLQLGAGEVGTALPPVLCYWREFGAR